MARVTVEDCVEKVPNRFDIVVLAAHRSRLISSGAAITVERDNDKNPVVALREIADGTIEPDGLEDSLVTSFQQHGSVNSQDETGQAKIIEDKPDEDSLGEEDSLHVMMATGMKEI